MIKYSTYNLKRVESIFSENEYTIRYERGNFKTGYCVLHDRNVIVVNKLFTTEGKITSLMDVLEEVKIDVDVLEPSLKTFYNQVKKITAAAKVSD